MNTLEVLKGVRHLLENPRNWTQRTPARDIKGLPVHAVSKRAVCWCTIGAVHKVVGKDYREFFPSMHTDVLRAIRDVLPDPYDSVAEFNNSTQHADVIQLLDRAIAKET